MYFKYSFLNKFLYKFCKICQRTFSTRLVQVSREHEELEERQQGLLEEIGDRLTVALQGEQFWKQTLSRVRSSLLVVFQSLGFNFLIIGTGSSFETYS